MIYICQIVQPNGSRSPAFPVMDVKKTVEDIRTNSLKNNEWDDVKKCGLLLLLAVDGSDSFSLSSMPVYSVDRYSEAFDSGIGLPDFQLQDFAEAMQDFIKISEAQVQS
nr:MAG: hypothetical protein [Microvirus sp.]